LTKYNVKQQPPPGRASLPACERGAGYRLRWTSLSNDLCRIHDGARGGPPGPNQSIDSPCEFGVDFARADQPFCAATRTGIDGSDGWRSPLFYLGARCMGRAGSWPIAPGQSGERSLKQKSRAAVAERALSGSMLTAAFGLAFLGIAISLSIK